jgi:large subunit ribosomal protein L32
MPPLPKRRRSKASKGTHNAHRQITLPNVIECPHCHRAMLSHRVCPACGYYNGQDVLGVETELTQ